MAAHLSPEEVLRKLMQGIADREFATLHELYAENCVVEHPFALPARQRTEGREAIRRQLRQGFQRPAASPGAVAHRAREPRRGARSRQPHLVAAFRHGHRTERL